MCRASLPPLGDRRWSFHHNRPGATSLRGRVGARTRALVRPRAQMSKNARIALTSRHTCALRHRRSSRCEARAPSCAACPGLDAASARPGERGGPGPGGAATAVVELAGCHDDGDPRRAGGVRPGRAPRRGARRSRRSGPRRRRRESLSARSTRRSAQRREAHADLALPPRTLSWWRSPDRSPIDRSNALRARDPRASAQRHPSVCEYISEPGVVSDSPVSSSVFRPERIIGQPP
jgi:hypothetical protein